MPEPIPTTNSHENEERFRLLVESVKDYAIFMLEPDGRVATWNPGAERLKQYRADEIIGQHFSKFYPPEDLSAGKPEMELERALADGRVEDEGWRLRKDGTRFWALVVITAVYDRHHQLTGFAKVTRDLTERRAAEEGLRASEELFRLLVDRVEEYAIYLLDPSGRVMSWNSGAARIKQFPAAEIIGKHFACFYTAEDVAAGKPQRNLEVAARLGRIHDQGPRVRKDGTTFDADVVITALRDKSGALTGFSKVTRDMSDQIRTRQIEAEKIAAIKANETKDEFLAKLSHELRTPLTPALAAASFMAENLSELPEKFSEDIQIIRRNVQLEARLIDDLLDLTRISSGKIELHQRRVDAHAVASDALVMARSDIHRKGLNVTTEWAATAHHIWADPVRLEQVFWNLINNAVKFTGPGGDLSIRTWNEDDHFHYAITDTGIGIAPDKQDSLFEAFEQGETGTARRFGGLGLGLAICKTLVELHGGTISVHSRGRSFGTTATVVLKCHYQAAAPPDAKELVAESQLLPLRILLVEDHRDTRRALERLLKHFGYEVATASTVKEALDTFRAQPFDAILSDIGLPDGTGYDVIAEAKRTREVKGVALTGYGMAEDVRRSKEAGFDFHITKPVDAAELRTILGQLSVKL
ncbi:MAG TPA: PAS domain S-box protein [Chthoniobacterales bacterium]|nr:PAS domain S-box protein [Chthoniobacterales bacterium]